jgi:hypothetical protein
MSAKETDTTKGAASTDAGHASKAVPPTEITNRLFHEAMSGYEKALESGVQLQEESVKIWKDLLVRIGTPEALRERLDSLSTELFPNARKELSEFMETFSMGAMAANRAGGRTLELVGKSLEIYQSQSIAETQLRVQALIEEALATGRENIRTVLNMNQKILGLWKDLAQSSPLKVLCTGA